MCAQLLGHNAEVAAVEIDGGPADLPDERVGETLRHVLAAHVEHLPGQALAHLLRRGRERVQEPHDAPQVEALLGVLQRAAPAVEPHKLRHRNAVAQRKVAHDEGAHAAAGALDHCQRLGHRELQERLGALGMQAPGDKLDGLEREALGRIAARQALRVHGRRQRHDVLPRLLLARCPALIARGFRRLLGRHLAGRRRTADQVSQEEEDTSDHEAARQGPVNHQAVLPQP